MIRASPEMLNCLNMTGDLSGNSSMETTSVLEKQRARMKWQQQQQELQQQLQEGYHEFNAFSIQAQAQHFEQGMVSNDSGLGELVNRVVKADPGLETNWPGFENFGGLGSGFGNGFGFDMNYVISGAACSPAAAMAVADITQKESVLPEKLSAVLGRESFKKRKADKSQNLKADGAAETKDKRLKGVAEEGDSKVTEQNSNEDKKANKRNTNRETSADTSKDNSKVSELPKPDYIHVRARRGQATDSHSLAERVRREKISERMKYLQDLVPGCNKIIGKAGMLDEIINYVQSLQRQVEFLSMKLAAVNPRLDFNIDNLFGKESFPTIGVSPEMANPRYLQFNPGQQVVSRTTPDTALQQSIANPTSVPETYLDSSYFNSVQPSSTWDADLQNLYSIEFPQGRSTTFPSQPFSGSPEAGTLKMEM